jgi:predicted house-cleaning NTP pyrophosphatase (Maf/HAM1 superfamily)
MAQVPSATVMAQAAKVAMEHDKPIYLDYYNESLEKKCCIGVQGNTKFLIKSDTEYTSPIETIMRIKEEKAYIVMTENSLYVVSADVPVKRIVGSTEGGASSS